MQQILVLLSTDADESTINAALGNGVVRYHLHPAVLIVDGDDTVLSSLSQTTGVLAAMSDDAATNLTQSTDMTQLDAAGVASTISDALGGNMTLDEATLLAVASWVYGFSPQYAAMQSDRPRVGENWDMVCMPTADFATA